MDLGVATPLEPTIDDLLEQLVAITRAQTAYVEAPAVNGAPLRLAYPRGDIALIRSSISPDIVQSALSEHRTMSAHTKLIGVQQHEIRAVVCAPINVQGLLGVIYLQGFSELTCPCGKHA